MTSVLTLLDQAMWAALLLPTMGYLTVSCFIDETAPHESFACSVLFTVFLMQLAVTIAVVAVIGLLIWLGFRAWRWWQGVGMNIEK